MVPSSAGMHVISACLHRFNVWLRFGSDEISDNGEDALDVCNVASYSGPQPCVSSC